ncbi:hypothetical protein B0T10DRAFT_78446 [Thelonectria olida]|uniref:U1-type domain-containing protein n=1 Tax=Thelonectria olida TaxID=1576542 RepID=A0A9P8VZP5_9HYPO|nr:hypothetical protein B0T10DRAFT_78446 [Thelonectria olida]
MADFWKSTPSYWCKYCSCYIRDTKFERTNHDASSKHQYAMKRFLRNIHREHEQQEREKKAAQREIARVTGISQNDASGPSASSSTPSTGAQKAKPAAPSEQQLQKQREQLAEMGVSIPSEFQPEMAIPGEWTVTKIIERKTEGPKTEGDGEEDRKTSVESRATGTRKREASEDQKAEEEAVKGLFKKPRRWGRDSRAMPSEEDKDLDALLNASTFQPTKPESHEENAKKEEDLVHDDKANIKLEEGAANDGPSDDGNTKKEDANVKTEVSEQESLIKPEPEDGGDSGITPIVFKKRKPRGIRQK